MPVSPNRNGFAAGTLILMADGNTKPIETLQSGEVVMSFDQNNAAAPLEPMEIAHVYKRLDHGLLEVTTDDNKTLRVAPGQLFINPGDDWRFATETAKIVDVDGESHKFEVNRVDRGKYWIYDITVDKNHSLVANGIRVHNSTGDSATNEDGSTGGNQTGPGRGPSCFVKGTKILLADGTAKNAEDVVVGDVLLGMNDSHNTVIELDCPALDYDRIPRLFGFNKSGHPFVTAEHPFYSERGWVSIDAKELTLKKHGLEHLNAKTMVVGDTLHMANGEKFVVESIDEYLGVDPRQTVYNYILDGNNTYYADGFVAHNRDASTYGGGDKPSDKHSPGGGPKGPNAPGNKGNPNGGQTRGGGGGYKGGGGGSEHGSRGVYNGIGNGQNAANLKHGGGRSKARNHIGKAKPDPKATALSTLTQIRDQMNFICTLLAGVEYSKWSTYKSTAITAADNSLALAGAYLEAVVRSTMPMADKSTLISRQGDITNAIVIIKAELTKTDQPGMNVLVPGVTNACANVEQFANISSLILSKYMGKTATNKRKFREQVNNIDVPEPPDNSQNVNLQGGANYQSSGNSYRVINGRTYQYVAGSGWTRVS